MKAWKAFEYALRDDLRSIGERDVIRVPVSGGSEALKGDVQSENYFVEAKRRKRVAVSSWLDKTINECPDGKTPILALKQHNQRGYIVVMRKEDYLKLAGELNRLRTGVDSELH